MIRAGKFCDVRDASRSPAACLDPCLLLHALPTFQLPPWAIGISHTRGLMHAVGAALTCLYTLSCSGFVGWTSFTVNASSAKEFYKKVEGLFGQGRCVVHAQHTCHNLQAYLVLLTMHSSLRSRAAH